MNHNLRTLLCAFAFFFGITQLSYADDVVDHCDAYLIPKNKIKDGSYYSFMGRTIESHSVQSYLLKQKLSEFKSAAYDICERSDFSFLHRTLSASRFTHLSTLYFETDFFEINDRDLSHISSSNEFIDADALLIVGSASVIGDDFHNLNLSLKRADQVVQRLKGRKDIFLLNIGAFGQDTTRANDEFYKAKRRSVSIYGLSYE
ncbi:hypothetical protein BS333_00995 [Vibrio azureus]|uniref:OmpA-like domain-containing protein n=1 Tax=Vibrio azureus NBRC 104587 TaxID=1219077 RepID=U3C2M6_9VIBR|nr:hypothetical protein [Vibrio azureus]AUI85072.1 hypothetical protein BS333_00995 [Vibrio azureus]GAD75709.1 hypothetical protein VAZ01S_028_00630 [Vibrio azureus NBRC 104587]